MPVRAFLDSDSDNHLEVIARYIVSMPVRAFLDSDGSGADKLARWDGFQCPSGHFLIQTQHVPVHTWIVARFQCPSGHFLIQTAFFSLPPGAQKTPAGRLFLQIPTHYTHFWASMPSFLPSHPSKQPVFAPPGAAGAMLRTPPPRKPIFWQNQGGGAQTRPAAAK